MSEAARPNGHFVDAGGVQTYYELSGQGKPLIFLGGGLVTAEVSDAQVPTLAGSYRVYVPERRGHGRTPDVEGPITYAAMAQDTIAFMDAVGIESAHLVGWSDGALVAMIVALRRPERVKKLVYIGQNLNPDDVRPEAKPILEGMTLETAPPMFAQLYAATSPDGPDHWPVVFEKISTMFKTDPGLAVEDLAGVKAPTLVLIGDDDLISAEHAGVLQRTLPDAQLAVVPGASHAAPLEKPELVNRLILEFLSDEQAPKMMPITGGH
jgi:pimeloyl-ACP methyl ester carboxylesterase